MQQQQQQQAQSGADSALLPPLKVVRQGRRPQPAERSDERRGEPSPVRAHSQKSPTVSVPVRGLTPPSGSVEPRSGRQNSAETARRRNTSQVPVGVSRPSIGAEKLNGPATGAAAALASVPVVAKAPLQRASSRTRQSGVVVTAPRGANESFQRQRPVEQAQPEASSRGPGTARASSTGATTAVIMPVASVASKRVVSAHAIAAPVPQAPAALVMAPPSREDLSITAVNKSVTAPSAWAPGPLAAPSGPPGPAAAMTAPSAAYGASAAPAVRPPSASNTGNARPRGLVFPGLARGAENGTHGESCGPPAASQRATTPQPPQRDIDEETAVPVQLFERMQRLGDDAKRRGQHVLTSNGVLVRRDLICSSAERRRR